MRKTVLKLAVREKREGFFRELLRVFLGIGLQYYWIEYRIDEDRYWYVTKMKWRRKKGHHTKQDREGSVAILRDIWVRAEAFGKEVEVTEDNRTWFTSFAKDNPGVPMGIRSKTLFLKD